MTDNLEKNFEGYFKDKNHFQASPTDQQEFNEKLPPGVYDADVDMMGRIHFNKIETNYDEILDLPSPEYTQVLGEMKTFLQPETKSLFNDFGFLYKRSCLLEGAPGTGKTVLINRVCEEVIKAGGIVLMNPDATDCSTFFKAIDSTQPDDLTLVVFEEFDNYFYDGECQSTEILSILDGEIQKKNVMYLATTNYPEKISKRFKRPGRFSSVIEMKMPAEEARFAFLKHKLGDFSGISDWVKETEGLTIDELKETVLAVKCLGQKLTPVIERLRNTRGESNAS